MIRIGNTDAFRTALHAVVACASTDETRPYLAAVIFEYEAGNLVLAATNGHVLCVHRIDGVEVEGVLTPFLMDVRDALVLSRALGVPRHAVAPPVATIDGWDDNDEDDEDDDDPQVAPSPSAIFIDPAAGTVRCSGGGFAMFFRKVDEPPVPWRKVIPQRGPGTRPSRIGFTTRYVTMLDRVLLGEHVTADFGELDTDPVLFQSPDGLRTFVVMPARI